VFVCNNNNNEGKQRKNANGNMQSVTKWKKGRKENSETETFKHMKIKYPTHLKMAM
jgi:hypothetical protein